jgi:ribosomal protein S18 acetylase RimI-like enzyme/Mn-dependent DtxR family transcriptional regulator
MDHLQSLGPLALASRLKNLSDTLMQGVARIYREKELDFEPRWFPVTHYLSTQGPVPVTVLSAALRQTHPAVLQVAQAMQKEGLVSLEKDSQDLRKTIVCLTDKGQNVAQSLTETWEAVSRATEKLLEENSSSLLHEIERIEFSLEREDIYLRVKKEIVRKNVDGLIIRRYTPDDQDEFREINFQWLRESVGISEYDRRVLENPVKEILDKSGRICMAFAGEECVGSFILLPVSKKEIELTKFAVKKTFRGIGIGKRMMDFAITDSRDRGYNSILLLTHPSLKEAISLYEKSGFVVIPGHPGLPDPTGRCSTTMQLIIKQ